MIPLHPKLVHFPVALLTVATLFIILSLIYPNKKKLFLNMTWWNVLLGAAFSLIALLSGLAEEKVLIHNNEIHELLEKHELLGFLIAGIFTGLTIWLGLRKQKIIKKELFIMVFIFIAGTALLVYSAHLGGKMVYEQGAGVVPMKEIIRQQPHKHPGQGTHVHQENNDPSHHNHDH